ncbi:4896_t:CDS:2 [Gigaspora margarita]|uniref:4896_t:CDS:1 n=1 Tax=Gigaspora margarita TaxID=4874 RepID=A0ABN7V257_GIGMA|nr:4896_t:CDS:2 [Gigaspora margarita]
MAYYRSLEYIYSQEQIVELGLERVLEKDSVGYTCGRVHDLLLYLDW